MKKIPFFPMRPTNGGCEPPDPNNPLQIARPKVDGSRVLVDIKQKIAWNRHGDLYSKSDLLPWDDLIAFAKSWNVLGRYVPVNSDLMDIEFLDKHRHYKHHAVFLDFPNRKCTFGELMKELGEEYPIRCGSVSSLIKVGKPKIDHEFTPRAGHMNVKVDYGKVLLLPYYDVEDLEVCIESQWRNIKNVAIDLMREHEESTPFYEGMVVVDRDSEYTKQIISPKSVSHTWVKHRFSN